MPARWPRHHDAETRHDPLNIDDARRQALFASRLQQSDAPTAETVTEAIRATVRQFGIRGCAGLMAQEFGDHPEAAAGTRWPGRAPDASPGQASSASQMAPRPRCGDPP